MIRRLLFGRRNLESSFSISTTLLVAVLMGATMFVVHSRVKETLALELEARGLAIARSIGAVATPSLFAYNYAALQIAAERASQDTGAAYVIIHDKEGVLAAIAGPAAESGTIAPPPDLVGEGGPDPAVGLRPSEVADRDSTTMRDMAREIGLRSSRHGDAFGEAAWAIVRDVTGGGEGVLEVAVPVTVEGVSEAWGTVRVGLSYGPVVADLRRIDMGLALLGLVLALAAALSGRWVARRITAPLRTLVEGTELLSAGVVNHRIPVSGAKELADLAGAFNLMAKRLQEKAEESNEFQQALEALNATLEWQVEERTRLLEESEAQYKTLVEHSPDSIVIVQQGRVRFVNPVFTETFGLTAHEVLHPDFRLEHLFDASVARLARERIEAWERGEPVSPVEVQGKDREVGARHFELRGSRTEYRGAPAAECLLIDMTEAQSLRERLSETEKMRALGELASGVAHDFNNLLGAILGRAQLLQRKGGVDPETGRQLAVIEKAALDGRETVRRIQEFSRTRRDKEFSPVDLSEVLRDSVEMTRTRWETEGSRRKGSLQFEIGAPPVPAILGNATQLREVFTNLIINALDAMPHCGRLRVSCRPQGDEVWARVEDTGLGMTEDIRNHIFDPFFTTKGQRGMGLGMSVVYGIVTRHGGQIDVHTELGVGTTFLLKFPAAAEAEIVRTEEKERESALGRTSAMKARILVIDDEPEIAEILKETLGSAGHMVESALNGSSGVKMARITPYDLVFSDLGMPDMSGWEVAQAIREHAPLTPVVLVTGWGASLDEDEVARRGIAAVVHKPFEIHEIIETASTVLEPTTRGRGGSYARAGSGSGGH